MTHLGSRVSALLDGQLGPEEEERAWAHVHGCHACRDLVEREGWVKTRLLGLAVEDDVPPSGLKGMLGNPDATLERWELPAQPRRYGMAVIGGGALGAAFLGVLALTAVPGSAPATERRAPVTSVSTPTRTPITVPSGAVTVAPAIERVGPHDGRAGVSGVRMVP